MTESYNPFVFNGEQIVDDEEIATITSADLSRLNADPQALYTQAEYDKLWTQYQMWKTHSQQLEDNLLAIADLLYQSLAFINGGRLYAGKPAIMMHNISQICENNSLLTELTADLRKASIESGYGIVSELEKSQNHLRSTVMQKWQERFQGEERDALGQILFSEQQTAAAAPPPAEDIF